MKFYTLSENIRESRRWKTGKSPGRSSSGVPRDRSFPQRRRARKAKP